MDFQAAWVKVKVTVAIFRKKKQTNKKKQKNNNFVMALVPTFIYGFQYYFICSV